MGSDFNLELICCFWPGHMTSSAYLNLNFPTLFKCVGIRIPRRQKLCGRRIMNSCGQVKLENLGDLSIHTYLKSLSQVSISPCFCSDLEASVGSGAEEAGVSDADSSTDDDDDFLLRATEAQRSGIEEEAAAVAAAGGGVPIPKLRKRKAGESAFAAAEEYEEMIEQGDTGADEGLEEGSEDGSEDEFEGGLEEGSEEGSEGDEDDDDDVAEQPRGAKKAGKGPKGKGGDRESRAEKGVSARMVKVKKVKGGGVKKPVKGAGGKGGGKKNLKSGGKKGKVLKKKVR